MNRSRRLLPVATLAVAFLALLVALFVALRDDPTGLGDPGPARISDDLKAKLAEDLSPGLAQPHTNFVSPDAPEAQLQVQLDNLYDDAGNLLQPGPSQGAAPNTAYGRPDEYFKSQGTKFEWQPSPNWAGRGTNPIEAIVVHVTAGGTCDGIVNYFKQSGGVASHFLACPDKVVQQVEIGDGAFHAGIWGARLNPFGNKVIDYWWRNGINPNSRTVGIETLLATGQQLDNFPTMRENLIDLLVWLVGELDLPPDREHIIGHFELDLVNRPSDPICCMNLDAVVAEVAKRVHTPEPQVAAPVGLTFQRWVGDAPFFDEFTVNGQQAFNAGYDFKLPSDVGMVDVEFFLRSGALTVYDGGSYPYGRACFVQANIITRCQVALDGNGWFAAEGQAVIDQLVITAAYRSSR